MICPPPSVAAPSTERPRPEGKSRLSAALLSTRAPPLLMVRLFRMCKGVVVPACASNKVLVAEPGALMMRLLTVRVVGKPVAVVTSLLTVLVPALVMKTMERPLNGGTPKDQLGPASHLPLALLVQLLVRPPAVTWRAWENSVLPL